MRKYTHCILVLLFTFGFSYWGYSQDYYGENLNSNLYKASQINVDPSVQTPDVAAFQKNSFVPVSNYTGKVNIGVPIYTIKSGGITIPISLSYNSSGVKVADMPSSVGSNWSLNAGGMITRIIKGIDDFHSPLYAGPNTGYAPAGWLGFVVSGMAGSAAGSTNRYNDGEPDHFVVSAPGLSTYYIHKRNFDDQESVLSLSSTPPDPIEPEFMGNDINETMGVVTKNHFNDHTQTYTDLTVYGLLNVDVTSLSGLVYSFATPDISRHQGGATASMGDSYKIESYHLDQIYDPATNRTVHFQYEQYSNYFKDDLSAKVHFYGSSNDFSGFTGADTQSTVFPVENRLTKITYDGGEVDFIYGATRQDNTGDKALTEIIVKDGQGSIVKHMKLVQSYFQSSISSGAQSKRLRLDRVYQVDANANELPGYNFTYNTSYTMPPRDSFAYDFLGYNNGTYNASVGSDPTPTYYFLNNKVSPFPGGIELTGNYSLLANVNYAKTYSLTKMTFPTGGYNSYEYELNTFSTHEGGGLRIKSQTIDDGKGNQQILDYTYSGGHIIKMPEYVVYKLKQYYFLSPTTYSELLSDMSIATFMRPNSQVDFIEGAFVGYSAVTVKDRVSNGKTVYSYSSGNVVTSTKTSDAGYSATWKTLNPGTLYLNNDFERGKITMMAVYDQNNTLKTREIYNYQIQNYGIPLSLHYFSKAGKDDSAAGSLCYWSNGDYKTSCGGYTENLSVPNQRMLLSSKSTYFYANGAMNPPFLTVKHYSYDSFYPLVLSEWVNNCEEEGEQSPFTDGNKNCQDLYWQDYRTNSGKTITYPFNSSLPYASTLETQHRLNVPMSVERSESGVVDKQNFIYSNFGNGIIDVSQINDVTRDNQTIPSALILQRDNHGNIEVYNDKDDVTHIILYGYGGQAVVAKIDNAYYSSVLNTGVNLSTLNSLTTSDSAKRLELDKIRSGLPDAQVTSYTYKPLVGITSMTDPKGLTSYYFYDSFNRLTSIKDENQKMLKEYSYHYKGQ